MWIMWVRITFTASLGWRVASYCRLTEWWSWRWLISECWCGRRSRWCRTWTLWWQWWDCNLALERGMLATPASPWTPSPSSIASAATLKSGPWQWDCWWGLMLGIVRLIWRLTCPGRLQGPRAKPIVPMLEVTYPKVTIMFWSCQHFSFTYPSHHNILVLSTFFIHLSESP